MTETNEYSVFPALRYQASPAFELHVGAEAKVVETKGGDSLVEQQQVYGSGNVRRGGRARRVRVRLAGPQRRHDRAARHGRARRDRRGDGAAGHRRAAPGRGLLRPEGWDATESFGGVEGSLAGYLGNQRLAFATRVGGRALWGAYPWFESASISGEYHDVRGYYDGRYRGDPSLYGNAELRWWIGKRKRRVLPVRWGLTTFVESGRVWYADENSKKWHTGYGARADAAADRHADGALGLDGQRHRGHPLLRRRRLLVLKGLLFPPRAQELLQPSGQRSRVASSARCG